MQERVTYESFFVKKKSDKNQFWKVVIYASIFLVLFIFLLVCFVQNFTKNRDDIFSKKTFFYLSLENTTSQNAVSQQKEKVQAVGGAGFVLKSEKTFHVLAYAYEKKAIAEEVASKISSDFDTQIIEKILPKISTKVKRQIKSEVLFLQSFKLVCEKNQKLFENISAHQKGELSVVKMYQFLKKSELEIETLQKSLTAKTFDKNAEKIKNQLVVALENAKSVFQNMSDEIYKSGNLSVSFKSGLILFCELHALLRENLNKIT